MATMDYLKRIGQGVKALGSGDSGDGTAKLGGQIASKIGGYFHKKAKPKTVSKPFDSGKTDTYG